MAIGDENGMSTTMLVAPSGGGYAAPYAYPSPTVYGGNVGGIGFGGGDWSSLITLLLLFGLFGGGFGGFGFGGMGGMMGAGMMGGMFGMDFLYPWLNNSQNINDGFRNVQLHDSVTSVRDGVQGLSTQLCQCCGDMQMSVANGFSGVQQSLANGFAGVQQGMCNGFNGVERSITGAQTAITQQMYANQIADMERSFAAQTASSQGFNAVQGQLAQCCCDNRAATADLKYTLATEECATRNAAAMNTRDIIDATTRGNQAILDKLCALELDTVKTQLAQAQRENVALQNAVNMATMQASQVAQTSDIINGVYSRLSTCPVGTTPVYGNTPIFQCPVNVSSQSRGCGCNGYVA